MRKIVSILFAVLLVAGCEAFVPCTASVVRAAAAFGQDQQNGEVLNTPRRRRRRRRVRGDVSRSPGVGGTYKRAGRHYGRSGKYAGRGGARFGKNIARAKPIVAGRELGKNTGKAGVETAKGTVDVGKGTARAGVKTGKVVGNAGAKTGKAVGRTTKRIFTGRS